MKLESLALWEEKELFGECSDEDKGYRGYCKYIFTSDGVAIRADNMKLVTSEEQYELVNLMHFLEKDEAHFLTRSLVDMEVYCEGRMNDHIPYAFDRACYGFRVVGECMTWYIACTTWNERCHFVIYAYHRETLRRYLARKRGLPEMCHGIYRFTGEQSVIFFGERDSLRFPQYGGNVDVNEQSVCEANKPLKVSPAQRAAMENGVIYGWETPVARLENYDAEGRYCPEEKEVKRKR